MGPPVGCCDQPTNRPTNQPTNQPATPPPPCRNLARLEPIRITTLVSQEEFIMFTLCGARTYLASAAPDGSELSEVALDDLIRQGESYEGDPPPPRPD